MSFIYVCSIHQNEDQYAGLYNKGQIDYSDYQELEIITAPTVKSKASVYGGQNTFDVKVRMNIYFQEKQTLIIHALFNMKFDRKLFSSYFRLVPVSIQVQNRMMISKNDVIASSRFFTL